MNNLQSSHEHSYVKNLKESYKSTSDCGTERKRRNKSGFLLQIQLVNKVIESLRKILLYKMEKMSNFIII